MFTKILTRAGQVRRFSIDARTPGAGWEVRVEHENTVVRRHSYTDWHRVERALVLLEAEVAELQQLGWEPLSGSSLPHSTNR